MKRALVSVSDKSGIVAFCQALSQLDYQIISTGGTKKTLDEAGVSTISIDEVTAFPEMLDGRVKTLHPLIHGGLLGIRDNASHIQQMNEHDIQPIDLVCVNLYPFKETISKANFTHQEAIENIDIGGPSMIRSAAKNHQFVTVVTDVNDYLLVIDEIKANGDTTLDTRCKLAAKAFRTTAAYDQMIQHYLTNQFDEENQEKKILSYELKQSLRYGENPHQKAAFYVDNENLSYSMANALQLHGKELSYNNIQDANATLQILKEFKGQSAVVAVKHMNPCGVAISSDITSAYKKCYEADPMSIFGGIVAFNEEVNEECATMMSQIFLEIILAPSFSKEAFEILSKKKNIRLMTFNTEGPCASEKLVSVSGGILVQEEDFVLETKQSLKTVTSTKPTDGQIDDALFGAKVCKHVKSNAIVLVKDGVTVGVGAGQMNRVGACKIACEQAGDKAKGSVLASDAFFPMDDTVALANEYGVSCIIQPGGSIKDQESIDLCDKCQIAMVFTGLRHFKH
ncbi:MAG: bifunctional phosphoribosylaminoimidazolecarboxamide formyltransferase/IMP cyclohydrolase [Erysipelotrichaceae bacterium]